MPEPLLTRADAVQAIKSELGIPVTKAVIDRAACEGRGPAPAARFGKRHYLYEKQTVLDWARTLITPVAA